MVCLGREVTKFKL